MQLTDSHIIQLKEELYLAPTPPLKLQNGPLAPGPENVLISTDRYCAVCANVQNKEPHQKAWKMLQTFSCVERRKKKDQENKFGGEAKVFIVRCESERDLRQDSNDEGLV